MRDYPRRRQNDEAREYHALCRRENGVWFRRARGPELTALALTLNIERLPGESDERLSFRIAQAQERTLVDRFLPRRNAT